MNITAAASAVNTENWLPAVGYEGVYEISDHGRVKRVRAANSTTVGRILKPRVHHPHGHLHVDLWSGGRRQDMRVHRIVLEAFVGPRPVGYECRHLDGNSANNRIENLCWGTHTQNEADKLRHGTSNRGEQNGRAKLTEDDVVEIRRLLAQGMTCVEISRPFGVDRSTIGQIKSSKNWSRVSRVSSTQLDSALQY